jgi:hypothetical protein
MDSASMNLAQEFLEAEESLKTGNLLEGTTAPAEEGAATPTEVSTPKVAKDTNLAVATPGLGAASTLQEALDEHAEEAASSEEDKRYFKLSRDMQVQQIAKIFNAKPKEHLDLCKHVAPDGPDGAWLRKLNRKTKIAKGSHMPVYPFPEYEEEVHTDAETSTPVYGDMYGANEIDPSGSTLSLQQSTASVPHALSQERGEEVLPPRRRLLFDIINTSKPGGDHEPRRSRRLSEHEHAAAMVAHIEHVSQQYNASMYKQERRGWSTTPMAALALHIEQTNRVDPERAIATSAIATPGEDTLGMLPGWESVTVEPKNYHKAHADPVDSVHWRRTEEIEWDALWRIRE